MDEQQFLRGTSPTDTGLQVAAQDSLDWTGRVDQARLESIQGKGPLFHVEKDSIRPNRKRRHAQWCQVRNPASHHREASRDSLTHGFEESTTCNLFDGSAFAGQPAQKRAKTSNVEELHHTLDCGSQYLSVPLSRNGSLPNNTTCSCQASLDQTASKAPTVVDCVAEAAS